MYSTEQIKNELWRLGIEILYEDLRVLLKYYLHCKKDKGVFVVTLEEFQKLKNLLIPFDDTHI